MRGDVAGRRAAIRENLAQTGSRVLADPDPAVDALARAPPQDADAAGGSYSADDLAPTLRAPTLGCAARRSPAGIGRGAGGERAAKPAHATGMGGIDLAAD